jgi:ABC-2 type transport system ATP-binding protein
LPELLLLDEPFAGLDPVNVELLKRMLFDLKNQGKALILSTHQMNEIEELCDRILMIDHGRSVLYGNLIDIKSRYRSHAVVLDLKVSWGKYRELPGSTLTEATLSWSLM